MFKLNCHLQQLLQLQLVQSSFNEFQIIKREDFSERLVMQHSNDGHVSNEKIELQGNMILELTL